MFLFFLSLPSRTIHPIFSLTGLPDGRTEPWIQGISLLICLPYFCTFFPSLSSLGFILCSALGDHGQVKSNPGAYSGAGRQADGAAVGWGRGVGEIQEFHGKGLWGVGGLSFRSSNILFNTPFFSYGLVWRRWKMQRWDTMMAFVLSCPLCLSFRHYPGSIARLARS